MKCDVGLAVMYQPALQGYVVERQCLTRPYETCAGNYAAGLAENGESLGEPNCFIRGWIKSASLVRQCGGFVRY